MAHVDFRKGWVLLLPFVLVFFAGLAADIAAIFLICNLPLMKRTWDQGWAMSSALWAALSLSLTVLIGSVLSGLILKIGLLGKEAYVPESFPIFLLRPTLEFFLAMLASLALALLTFGLVRGSLRTRAAPRRADGAALAVHGPLPCQRRYLRNTTNRAPLQAHNRI
ncbi:hypothetical protein [Breoghania sp.]|uniref:hypothetical protein n=1 Tax=Breoghania sp. TaxID=2065378 RepID=UPI0026257617|nr:hypothetical protein [Breoghania sp.]MDJ0930964.1 hypothetical protein [Breoghania sp.]